MDINSYQKYLDTVHDLANVEYDLREVHEVHLDDESVVALVERVLFERFGIGEGL